ncbi:Rrp15p-domain-containing protein [Xylariaceae sp. FL0255]|nr:Rrp15p-domain-containing protein [Xylariaceae sp. FL0255]
MAAAAVTKRSHGDSMGNGKPHRPSKKQRKIAQYQSDSDDHDDLENALVDDVASTSASDSDSEIASHPPSPVVKSRSRRKMTTEQPSSRDKGSEDEEEDDVLSGEEDDDDEYEEDEEEDGDNTAAGNRRPKSKRNDPGAFATSLQKILSTKLSNAKKSDAILSRSVEAQKASRDIVDAGLEAKARKLLRDQKLLSQEKGRVKDVMAGGVDEDATTGEILQVERRLRKTAHRGVIMLFRAVREAQERANVAEKDARKDGIIGASRRQEKVNEMSKQGFMDLIAGGGGKLKKGGLEEA